MFPDSVEVQALVKSKGLFSFYENGHQECCRACWKLKVLTQGQCFHGFIAKSGCTADISVQNSFVSFYGKTNNTESVQKLFYEISERDVISWSLLISSCVQAGDAVNAMQLFKNMSMENGIEIDGLALVSVLQAYSFVGYVNYAKCSEMGESIRVFEGLMESKVVWTSVVSGYQQKEQNLNGRRGVDAKHGVVDYHGPTTRMRSEIEDEIKGHNGHPALIGRHRPFPVTHQAAERWLQHMQQALDITPNIDPDSKIKMMNFFRHTAFFLVAGNEITRQAQ
ncbi:hypothetical protein M5K25_003366 [Dendrobium thyrsiflorum]|uniref:Pentatricopeptide repeat-containing protein n=1 Tax=Dendrobium thyrsiflorum TaxID=117978 RepID=A0ABD0VIR0_DENTH